MFSSINRFSRKAYRPVELVQEAWLAARAPHNATLFNTLFGAAQQATRKPRLGFAAYLRDHPAISEHAIVSDWSTNHTREWSLVYSNTMFAEGAIHARIASADRDVLIFLPGYYVGAEQVLREVKHPQYMVALAERLNVSLVTWTWPIQGNRGNGGLFKNMRSVVSIEREYARILPTLSTSLWREFIAEFEFVLSNVERLFDRKQTLHVVGWSMGGGLAYFAPLLSGRIKTVVSTGSCARLIDLLQSGRTRAHSFYFYPHDCLRYFDLDEVVAELVSRQVDLRIIYGDNDPGCMSNSSDVIAERTRLGTGLSIDIVPGHGHYFSEEMKRRIAASLEQSTKPSSAA